MEWIIHIVMWGLGALVLVHFIYWRLGRALGHWTRMAEDPAARAARLAALTARLERVPGDDEARRERATLRQLDGQWVGAIEDQGLYLEHRPGDDVGWCEYAEMALRLERWEAAAEAIERAAALDPAGVDPVALSLRLALHRGDLEGARERLAAWKRLDAARIATPAAHHPWSVFRQAPSPARRADPAVAVYEAVLLARTGDEAGARGRLAEILAASGIPPWIDEDPLLTPLRPILGGLEQEQERERARESGGAREPDVSAAAEQGRGE